ncbi:non-ribosomal peptide synthetase [Kitasatospora sp. MBT66]|uniref:non-ribosomal peptide synthetase n=1 Tax=Kitasatospora sp. MBT66 TaxID=1444769 RepID=UPI0005BA7781|nr:non-ribosomal peptide synthetase [Kitasatospora sp. MBT66]
MIDLQPRDPARTAAHAFARVAAAVPARPAVRHGADELTYAELAERAGGVAERLRALGVGRGDVVATLLDRSELCAVAVLGAWAVGAAYVHIEPTDPDARVAALLAAVVPGAVLTDRRNEARIPAGAVAVSLTDAPPPVPYRVSDGLGEDDFAYLVFTSGSTGVPKTVEVGHRALLNFCAGFRGLTAGLEPLESYGATTTFAADIGKASVYGALLSGARLDVYDRAATLDPQALAAELRRHPVDALTYTPSLLEALASEGELAALLPRKLVVFIGEALPPRLVAAILAASPGIEIHNGYGPAEATIFATAHRVRPADTELERTPVGHPLPGVLARVLDDGGGSVPDGTAGVLHLGGECLAGGYRGDEEKTAAKFVHIGGERLYRTDDLVVRDADGCFDYLGRVDSQLKIRGNRVEPGEVETALLAVPGVRLAVVTGERASAGAPMEIAAYVVGTATRSEIVARLAGHLPAALIPSRIHPVPNIPVNQNGKADLKALRALAAEPEDRAASAQDAPEAPAGEVEEFVAAIWCEVLGAERVGRHEQFAEVGGTSFNALTVYGRLRRRYPGFAIAQLYAHPTVAQLAAVLSGTAAPTRSATAVVEL